MALIIEDGSIVAGANSYVTGVEYLDWSDARFGNDRSARPAQSSDADRLILRSMDYFETLLFQGSKSTSGQSLQWPRNGVVIDGFSITSSEIPNEVKVSIFELAYAEETGSGEMNAVSPAVKKERVDVIEVEYKDGGNSSTINVSVSATLKKLLSLYANSGNSFSVSRV